ncbi:MAG: Nitrate/nitrite response regulator protein [uncultured Thermomicrobiales bacterium]|uniref:Nitrate/nitrite response regulator protein n=1 Tax=uncultured Thermomicrobiales bacterium TaxID=1645740 RepID=A0A6J4UZX7_9BACT|nr:MAG: Nitrate/nitrite response regulator protein [uncultured Thermomicrobiales bacterium]
MDSTVRIVVADDHPLFRKGMVTLLSSEPGFSVVGEAATGAEAIGVVAATTVDVVLMDLQMPEMGGIPAIQRLKAQAPEVRILVVTLFEDEDSVFLALRAGAHGYVLKDAWDEEFIRAIKAVAAGESIFSPAIATRVLAWFGLRRHHDADVFTGLTHREREILDELANGYGNAMIARHLGISSKTVANHLSTIFAKLQVPDRGAAIVRARDAGFGASPPDGT